ncbi:MAG: hypothetical protein IJ009_04395 [Clostridia bacterium]|nr:hypothetical protein [Clostridia bacterium]
MTLSLPPHERAAFAALCETEICNRQFFAVLAHYLSNFPRLVSSDMIAELTRDCGVTENEAFCAVLAAALDLDEDRSEREARLVRRYLPSCLRAADPAVYRADPYFKNIRVPHRRIGEWLLTEETYVPYEGFVCGHLVKAADMIVPPVAYFTEEFSFPAVMQNGVEWMAIKPNEIETMRAPVTRANGHVLAAGLGLGYFAYMAARKENVKSVTVVERDPSVISLFESELLPQFECHNKIRIVRADAIDYFEYELPKHPYDYVFADLWHDASDGLPLYARLRRIEDTQKASFDYWVEDMLLSHLHAELFCELEKAYREGGRADGIHLSDMTAVRTLLGDPALRAMAPALA